MPSTPWTIQRSKRKQPVSEPPARKRVRISDDVNRATPTTSRTTDQKTLTQIDFVQSPCESVENDRELQEVSPAVRRDTEKPPNARRRLRKQSSTLTQMPWFQDTTEHVGDDALEEIGSYSVNEQQICQLGGGVSDAGVAHPQTRAKRDRLVEQHRDSSKLGKREKGSFRVHSADNSLAEDSPLSRRRRSGRIATMSSTMTNVLETGRVQQTHAPPSTETSKQTVFHHPAPLLEIQDSTEMAEIQPYNGKYDKEQDDRHSTPPRQYIASSQTPETEHQSTVRQLPLYYESPTKASRTPLAERSTNIPTKQAAKPKATSKLTSLGTSPPPRKICILKVPSRTLLRRGSRVEDSLHDVYSLQATSSPVPQDQVSQDAAVAEEELSPQSAGPRASASRVSQEIPQSASRIESQASLPQLSDLVPSRKRARLPNKRHHSQTKHFSQAAACDAVHIRDFGNYENCKRSNRAAVRFELDDMLLEGDTILPDLADSLKEDEDAELHSPILNDTQFNTELQQYTSSPPRKSDRSDARKEGCGRGESDYATPKQRPNPSNTSRESDVSGSNSTQPGNDTPIPIPRLVARATPSAGSSGRRQHDRPVQESMLPPAISHSNTILSLSRVPLNDLSTASSLPTSTQIVPTQKSAHPASMRHPSQMSTQDLTQNLFPSSIAHSVAVTQQAERIIIKDSSSEDDQFTPIQLCDSAAHMPGLDSRVIGDSEDELDDLDLDVVPNSKHQNSARKPVSRQVTKTESSLKSIHVSAIPSSESSHYRSSSPVLPVHMHKSTSAPIQQDAKNVTNEILDLLADIPTSSSSSLPVSRARSPIPGFDNDTQSNFTQNGHVTAAYIHKQRDLGRYPKWFVPKPTVVPGSVRKASSRKSK